MKKLIILPLLIAVAISGGCYKADIARNMAWNSSWKITHYPPGHPKEEFHSDGKPISEPNSDGYHFVNKETGKIVEISGTIKVEQE